VSVHEAGTSIALTPVYDVLSTLPYGDARMALSMEGRDDRIHAAHFLAFGERVGVRPKAVEAMLNALCRKVAPALSRLSQIGLAEKKTQHLERVMRERLEALSA
jgi:serine/threonine-protein kinase HipA